MRKIRCANVFENFTCERQALIFGLQEAKMRGEGLDFKSMSWWARQFARIGGGIWLAELQRKR
jgi:hypothetical protein